MAKHTKRLTDLSVKAAPPGKHHDGSGLYLEVQPSGSRQWFYRFRMEGRDRHLGLGGYPDVSLYEARQARDEATRLIRQGIDPVDHKRKERETRKAAREAEARRIPTFREEFESYMRSHQGKWSASHARDWQASIENHAIKELGAVPVDEIRLEHVLRVLRPIWNTKTITAARVQNRIESLLDYATVHGHRAGENPARWTGYLSELLPAPGSIAKPDPHRALDYRDVTQFCEWLREVGTVTALSIEFLLLTATRLREVLDAEWSEIDLDAMTWVIPANRMKAGREHRVPLSTRAAAIIATMRSKTTGRWVFPGPAGKPLSNAACHQLLKGSEWVSKTTIHGLRATFRTWAADCTAFDYETIESSLAHSIGGNVERRYLRSDFFDRRRALMQAWNDYATNAETADNVVPMTRERSM